MALEFETTHSQEPSLEIAAMDFIGFRRTDRATRARQSFSAGGKFGRQSGLAAPPASLAFTTSWTILNLYAPRRCGDGELHGSNGFVTPSNVALSRRSAMSKLHLLYPTSAT